MSCLGLRYSDRSPTRALDQATATQSPRCPASICLQDSKTERTYKYNRTATVQQYRYSNIEQQFSSISTVYSSTIRIHPPPANSPTLNHVSTQGVKSKPMSVIGISASETNASYRLLCRELRRTFYDHEGYDTSLLSKTGALGTLKGPLPNLSPVSEMSAPGISVFPLATFSHHLARQSKSGRNRGLTKRPTYSPDRTKVYCSNRGTIYSKIH